MMLFWIYLPWLLIGMAILVELVLFYNEKEDEPFPVVVAIITMALLYFFTDVFAGFRLQWLYWVPAYGLAGAAWSVWKWYSYVVNKRDALKADYDRPDYVNKSAQGNLTWESYSKGRRPEASDNKQRIVNWMMLWPCSMMAWVLSWPRRFFSWVYNKFSVVYEKITDKVWAS